MTDARPGLAVFDVDGTLRRVRDPWVHLHKTLGVAEHASSFIGRWQRGEISYEEWAALDAALWRGYGRREILAALRTNPLREGARDLVGWFASRAVPCVAISTGLSVFNDVTASELGIGDAISNELVFDGDICAGEAIVRVREDNKRDLMEELLEIHSVRPEDVVAFGDGTADIPVLTAVGLGIAVCPANEGVRSCVSHVVETEPIDVAIRVVEEHFGE
jgi:phosphoserine phosphatase